MIADHFESKKENRMKIYSKSTQMGRKREANSTRRKNRRNDKGDICLQYSISTII
jgi:hypothetical protein